MNIIWLFYWIGLLVAVILSFLAIKKKSFLTGIIQLILSVVVPLGQLFFSVVNNAKAVGKNEFCFLMDYVGKGNIVAILIFIGYLAIVGLAIYHIVKCYGKKDKSLKK